MMEALATLGRVMGFSFAAGINLYATVAILGLAARYDWVALPPQFQIFDNDIVIIAAVVLYVIEFLADKVPWVDTVWDAIHTVIRPIGGALIAVSTLGEATPTLQGLTALSGGLVAASTHFTKAGARVVANTSPEPFSNWVLSLAEDVFVIGLAFVALRWPIAALVVTATLLVVIVWSAAAIVRAVRRRWRGRSARARPLVGAGL